VVGLILATSAERKINQSGGSLTGLDQARAAKIISIVALAITLIGVLALVAAALTAVIHGS
jgi:hypothetical protein